MKLYLRKFVFSVIVSVAFFVTESKSAEFDPIDLLAKAKAKYEQIEDYTATFVKQQRIGGKLQKKEELFMKFKKPFCIYYKWLRPDKGKEVIYVDGKNNNKLIAHLGGAASFFPISKWIKPTDPIAMSGNRYPITRSGIGNAIDSLMSQFKLAADNNELSVAYLGIEVLDGRRTHVIARRLPKDKKYACYISIINIDIETKLPIRIASLDWDFTVKDIYYYKNLKINQGLTDQDFNPNNKAYRFGIFKF